MAFINEKISKEDWEKYNIDQINMRWNGAGNPESHWVIDSEREIWLRKFYEDRDRDNNGAWDGKTVWDFYWKGILMSVTTDLTEFEYLNKERDKISIEYRLVDLYIPLKIKNINMTEILSVLQNALFHYGLSGVYGRNYREKLFHFDISSYKLVDTGRLIR